MSPALRAKVVMHVNKAVLGKVHFFDGTDPEFVMLIIQALKPASRTLHSTSTGLGLFESETQQSVPQPLRARFDDAPHAVEL